MAWILASVGEVRHAKLADAVRTARNDRIVVRGASEAANACPVDDAGAERLRLPQRQRDERPVRRASNEVRLRRRREQGTNAPVASRQATPPGDGYTGADIPDGNVAVGAAGGKDGGCGGSVGCRCPADVVDGATVGSRLPQRHAGLGVPHAKLASHVGDGKDGVARRRREGGQRKRRAGGRRNASKTRQAKPGGSATRIADEDKAVAGVDRDGPSNAAVQRDGLGSLEPHAGPPRLLLFPSTITCWATPPFHTFTFSHYHPKGS
mmetsp:Transcript_495/g.1507  ORF Transcript_495/g.1507 Transcript_495/m.1507 type:complete len:265 (+) Transcript_495:2687-3481(+)